jgi:hypothetical protein
MFHFLEMFIVNRVIGSFLFHKFSGVSPDVKNPVMKFNKYAFEV